MNSRFPFWQALLACCSALLVIETCLADEPSALAGDTPRFISVGQLARAGANEYESRFALVGQSGEVLSYLQSGGSDLDQFVGKRWL